MLRASVCRWLLLVTGIFLIWPVHHAAAQSATPPKELFTDQPKGLSDHVVAWKFIYTGELFGDVSGGMRQGAIYEGMAKFGVGVNLEKLAGWDGATLYANVIQPHGPSLTQRYTGDFNVVSNIDTTDSLRFYKLWLQQNLDDNRWSLRVGQIAADKELFLCDGSSVFFNNAFGTFPVISANLNSPIFPLTAPGFRARWTPSDDFSLLGMVFSGDVGNAVTNPHNLDWSFASKRGLLALLEATVRTSQGKDATGLPGAFKLGAFHDSASFADPSGGNNHQGDTGFYAIADQMVYRESGAGDDAVKGLKAFARGGWTPQSDRNSIVFDFETGLNYAGLFPSRDSDLTGVGFAITRFGEDYLRQAPGIPRHEAIIEATHLVVINDHWSLQPDFQYIIHPSGAPDLKNAFVAGLRFTMSF